jgi:hypothetical protein
MGRMYSVSFSAVAATAAQDLFEITPADDKPCRIAALFLAQTTDVGDSEEEIIELLIKRGNTTSGSGGSVGTIESLMPTAATPGFSAEVNNTTRASAGTVDNLLRDGWNVRQPYAVFFPEDMRPGASQGNTTLIVGLEDAPADSITINGTVIIEELG